MTGSGRTAGPHARFALPAVSGVLLALAFPPLHLLLPAFLALVPLALWVERAVPDGRTAFRGGVIFGAVSWGLLLHWMPLSLGRFTPWAWLGWAVAVALLSLHAGAVVWGFHRLRHQTGVPLWLALPLAWTAGEVLRARLPGSLAFPWLELATGLAGFPELLGLAEIAGARGVGFWLALVQGLVAWTVVGGAAAGPWSPRTGAAGGAQLKTSVRSRNRVPPRTLAARLALTGAVLAAPAVWSVHRAGHLDLRPVARLAVVQPSIPQALKLRDPAAAADRGLRTAERWAETAGPLDGVDAVILPEAVVPLEDGEAGFRRRVEALADRLGAPVLLGSLAREAGVPFNSVFQVLPGSGVRPERYDKRHLVPVVERVPLGPLLEGLWSRTRGGDPVGEVPSTRRDRYGSLGFGAGPEVLGDPPLGPLVCWESAFALAARSRRRAGARVLVNVTNDAWFNGPTVWHRSVALWQHPAHLVLRAVETRTGAVRAANTGLSLVVDAAGHPEVLVPPWEEGVAVVTVRSTEGATVWVRIGDVPAVTATVVALALIGLGWVGWRPGPRHSTGAGG